MENKPKPLRERLLAQYEPDREKLATYRKEVAALLVNHEDTLRWQVVRGGDLDLRGRLGDLFPDPWRHA